MDGRRIEDHRLDDWTAEVDAKFRAVSDRQGEMARVLRELTARVDGNSARMVELSGEVRRLREAPVLAMTGIQQDTLAELAAERAAQKVVERRAELIGKRWQRWAVVITALCTPLALVLSAIALAVTGRL